MLSTSPRDGNTGENGILSRRMKCAAVFYDKCICVNSPLIA